MYAMLGSLAGIIIAVSTTKLIVVVSLSPHQEQYKPFFRVQKHACIFLKAFARDNPVVKDRLMERIDLLLGARGSDSELAMALEEVFCWFVILNPVLVISGMYFIQWRRSFEKWLYCVPVIQWQSSIHLKAVMPLD